MIPKVSIGDSSPCHRLREVSSFRNGQDVVRNKQAAYRAHFRTITKSVRQVRRTLSRSLASLLQTSSLATN